MASIVTNRGKLVLVDGTVTWGTTSLGVLLATSSYVPNADHNVVADVTNELAGGGYARGTLGGETGPVESDASDRVEYDADDQVFTALGAAAGTPQWAVLYDNTTGADATRPIIAIFDLGTPDTPNGTDYTVQWATPMLTLT